MLSPSLASSRGLGEKQNRNRARLKFLVANLGIDEFRRLVLEERELLPYDERWVTYLDNLDSVPNEPKRPSLPTNGVVKADGFAGWLATNVYWQRQPGYAVVTLNLPLGDLSSHQALALAGIARTYVGDNIRTTVEQNIVLRWVAESDLAAVHGALAAAGLATPGAGTIMDITSCPGTDTCKLGIAASRGLAGELGPRLAERMETMPDAVKDLKIKVSGCFNSCGQHHVADIGFFGNSRRRNNRVVPHFQVVLGGMWQENAGSYGLAVGAVPSKKVPEVLDAITERYVDERGADESFQQWIARIGKREARAIIDPFMEVPEYSVDPSFYSDWSDPREFTIGDIGVGECAGEVVSLFAIEVARAEGRAFDALISLDERDYTLADAQAYESMLLAAKALVRNQFLDVGDDPQRIVDEFRTRYYDTQLFFDQYAKGKFAHYLFDRHDNPPAGVDADVAQQIIGEANLFIEAAHACDARMAQTVA